MQKVGWLPLFSKYSGDNVDVIRVFSLGFNGDRATIRDLELIVSKDSSSQTIKLSQYRERWFKNMQIEKSSRAPFLKPTYMKPEWSKDAS